MTDDQHPTIPGLDEFGERATGPLEAAVRRTLTRLAADGNVVEADAGKVALAVELAQVIALKRRSGRASTIGHDARVLMEILDSFVDEATDVDEGLRQAMAEWAEL